MFRHPTQHPHSINLARQLCQLRAHGDALVRGSSLAEWPIASAFKARCLTSPPNSTTSSSFDRRVHLCPVPSVTSSSVRFGQDNRVVLDYVLSCGARILFHRHNASSDDNRNSRPFRRIVLLSSGDSPINTGLVPSPLSLFLIMSSSPRKRASIA